MASCKADEKSYFDRKTNHGIFTLALIEALEGKNTAGNKKFVSFNDICQYLIEQVPIRTFQLSKKTQTPIFNLTDFVGFDVCYNSYIPPKSRVFIISDPQDNAYLESVSNSLKVLETRGLIHKWSISQIPAGAIVKDVLNEKIANSDIILGLVSTNYLNSDTCLTLQTKAILEGKMLIPVILEDCLYVLEKDIESRELTPQKSGSLVPVVEWIPQNAAYTEISRVVLRNIQSIKN
ncbi:MAG: TIR domain-containing protein [Saprospiraceae bacterium]|nr:TIR domain-containing protein [Saprospiraceae bacterium]